ncbi:uncharacterized protein [Nicotiana sylvestris]|uniref:uncharacterized protein n=1 Tax=Nicotiana sylvestris TaxID=4096 RepID=UPI00388C3E0B
MTWTEFSDLFLREYVPQSLTDAWRAEFEYLRQGAMVVLEYVVPYTSLARNAPALVSTVRERVRRYIKGLIPSIRSSMARELDIDISYQLVLSITRRIEGMHAREREERKAKRSQESGHFSGARAPVAGRYGRGYMSRCSFSSSSSQWVLLERYIGFDPGSTYSSVSSYFAPHLGVTQDSLSSPVYVSTPMGDSFIVDHVYRSCSVAFSGFETRVNLLFLSMVDFDIILGMDWLLHHYAILGCHVKIVMLTMPGIPRVE